MIGARILSKKRIVEIGDFETTSTSAAFVPARMRSRNSSFARCLVEVSVGGAIVISKICQTDSDLVFNLSSYAGVKQFRYKIIRSRVSKGELSGTYTTMPFVYRPEVMGIEFDCFASIVMHINALVGDSETPNVNYISNSNGNLKILWLNYCGELNCETLSSVENMNMFRSNEISDVSMLVNLKALRLGEGATISDISTLSNLESVNIQSSAASLAGTLDDMMPYMANLTEITLFANIDYSAPLQFNASLQTLNLNCPIGSPLNTDGQLISNIIRDVDNSTDGNIPWSAIYLTGNCAPPVMDVATQDHIISLINKGYSVSFN